jgi:hypothetical protein
MDLYTPSSSVVDGLQAELHAELETTRQTFHALLATLIPSDWSTPSTNPAWTNGELLWHITGYLYIIPEQLELLRAGTFPDMTDVPTDELNQDNETETRAHAHTHTLLSIAPAYEDGHASTLKALQSIQDHEWEFGVRMPDMGPTFTGEYRTIETLFRYHTRHFAEHAAQIAPSRREDQ